ncbi:MAG TPA: response regulator [bacterium]|mgnify:CR=1 FL=1|nr:response regulator [bacterium]
MARILIADDTLIMRSFIKTVLIKAGHSIAGEAENGEEAYNKYKEVLPDIVTMDITMPVLNGIEASKKILNEFPKAKIIMTSALEQKNVILEALEIGVKNYILKPINKEKMIDLINEVVNSE